MPYETGSGYKSGQFFELTTSNNTKELYILVFTGEGHYLIEVKSGNRWCEPNLSGVYGERLSNEHFARIASGQPNRFVPVDVTFSVRYRTEEPSWEVE